LPKGHHDRYGSKVTGAARTRQPQTDSREPNPENLKENLLKTRSVVVLVVCLFVLCIVLPPSKTVAQLAYPSLPTPTSDQSLRPLDLRDRSLPLAHSSATGTTQSRISDPNLLLNGSFEQGESSPAGWSPDAWNSSYTVFSLDSTQAVSGSRSVKIESTAPNDARWIQTVSVLPNVSFVQPKGEPLKTPQNHNFSGKVGGAGKPTRV